MARWLEGHATQEFNSNKERVYLILSVMTVSGQQRVPKLQGPHMNAWFEL